MNIQLIIHSELFLTIQHDFYLLDNVANDYDCGDPNAIPGCITRLIIKIDIGRTRNQKKIIP